MFYLSRRSFAHRARTFALACVASITSLTFGGSALLGGEGHNHGPEPQPTIGAASPRVVATSETYQFVGIVEGEVLVIYLDRADDNSPVTNARLEVMLDGEAFTAELQPTTKTYEVTSPMLRKAGNHEVLVTLAEGSTSDLLAGSLVIPATSGQADGVAAGRWISKVPQLPIAIGAFLLLGAAGALAFRRRGLAFVLLLATSLGFMAAAAWAHEGHDHGPDVSASTGNAPSRRADGTIFVPKPTQRLLEIRTVTTRVEAKPRTVRFNGRVIANPNRSGVVQSTIQGRYEPPEGGVPNLGTPVKAGDLLGRVAPSFASIDTSDMGQTLGNLDQEIALNRRKLARQEQLLQSNVVAKALVEDIRIQLEGLEKRRRDLLAAKVRPEELRAPVDGLVASSRVVAGQVVAQSDQLFQIIDPGNLLIEALVFDQINPDAVQEATATVNGSGAIKLKFLGRSRALQQQYSILQFQIIGVDVSLDVGTPVTVIAPAGEPMEGIVLPHAALAQAANGQTVVLTQKEPEVFLPKHVRTESFDSQNVLIKGGLMPGEKVVVQNATLLNQVR